jgi:hypothetical protein
MEGTLFGCVHVIGFVLGRPNRSLVIASPVSLGKMREWLLGSRGSGKNDRLVDHSSPGLQGTFVAAFVETLALRRIWASERTL